MLLNRKHLLLALLALHCVLLAPMGGLSRAEEDEVEEEDEEGVVEEEGGQPDTASDSTEEAGDKTTSPDADTTILFTRPPGTTSLGRYLQCCGSGIRCLLTPGSGIGRKSASGIRDEQPG
jgi:hypothetical protein